MKKKKLARLICISSLFQLFVAHSCLKKKKDLKKYFNIIVLTSSNIHVNNFEKIKNFSNSLGYKNVINLSNQIKKLTPSYSLFLRKDLMNKFKNYEIGEILIRYKFNLFEHTIFSSFNKAKISIFEDGMGDYMKHSLLDNARKKNKFKDFLNYLYYRCLNYDHLFYFNINHSYPLRIQNKFELINDCNGDLKSHHISNKPFINIKNEFLKVIKKLKTLKFKRKTVLFLIHDIDEYFDPARTNKLELEKNIQYYIKARQLISKKFPNYDIIFKTHPNIRNSTLKILRKYNLNILSKNFITEMLINNKKIFCVIGFASSSLIYAKKIFKKKTISFDTNKLNFHAIDNQSRSIFDVLKRFKIDILEL